MRALCEEFRVWSLSGLQVVGSMIVGGEGLDEKILQVPAEAFFTAAVETPSPCTTVLLQTGSDFAAMTANRRLVPTV